jgi:hypothetical protein
MTSIKEMKLSTLRAQRKVFLARIDEVKTALRNKQLLLDLLESKLKNNITMELTLIEPTLICKVHNCEINFKGGCDDCFAEYLARLLAD